MDFNLTDDQLQLRDGLRRYLAEQYDFETRRKRLNTSTGTDRGSWAGLAEMGWLSVLVPEQAGGLGWSMIDAAVVTQEFGRGLVVEPFLEAGILATRILALADTETGNKLLPALASGEQLIAPALTEADSRYNANQISARVEIDGSALRLSGNKILVAGGDVADQFIVSATGNDGPALILVPADCPGLGRRSYRGMDGGWLSDVTLNNIELPSSNMLAGGNRASEILTQALDDAAIGAGAEAVGCMDRVLEMTAEYLRSRQQFGQPLADFQVLQHRMADLFVEVEMARSALHSGLAGLQAPPDQRAAAVSAARVRIDRAGHKVGNQGIHLHGGMGMTIEYPVGHFHRRLLVLARSFGDTVFHFERYKSLKVVAA